MKGRRRSWEGFTVSNYLSARQQYSFEYIYQQYTPLVYGMLKRLHIHSNHEDFVQAGYVGLWLAYQHHDGEKGPFPPLCFRSCQWRNVDDAEEECQLLRSAYLQSQ
ncbi:hypothetical protein DT065_04060 [Salicibibacter kimchii]|uniref:RNA polymerase sigma-70 region 2 domain-containing protein n=1 Tax=Salicibibacter kimchii TaxID=2099786 RepID=A0A345BWE3_9BACI|nr:hypothetical protein DT065_04060 [Salicibibacter kimchii]